MSNLKKLLIDLSSEPSVLKSFKDDPEKAMSAAGLSEEEKETVRSGDPSRIKAVFDEGPEALTSVVVVVVVAVIK